MDSRRSSTVVPQPALRARLPTIVRLPMLIVLNISLQSALWTAWTNFFGAELGTVSKQPQPDDWIAPVARLATKAVMLSLAWWMRFDYLDMGALAAMINVPYAYLLNTYYDTRVLTATAVVFNEFISIALPTYLLRPISDVNNPTVSIRNRYLLNSTQVSLSNTTLAIGVYVVSLLSVHQFGWLSEYLISHFDVVSLVNAHNETPFTLIGKLLAAGVATKTFLLNPSIGAAVIPGTAAPAKPFDPARATLPQTFEKNFWFFSRRTRTLIQRTTVLSLFLLVNTIQRCATLQGSDLAGPAGYAGVWVAASTICGLWFAWTGDEEA